MYSICVVTISAFLLTLLLTPLVRDWSVRLGLVDKPDDHRKKHAGPTPRTGGIPILAGYVAAYGLLLLLPLRGGEFVGHNLSAVWRMLPPVAVMFGTGLLDDWLCLKPWHKLA